MALGIIMGQLKEKKNPFEIISHFLTGVSCAYFAYDFLIQLQDKWFAIATGVIVFISKPILDNIMKIKIKNE